MKKLVMTLALMAGMVAMADVEVYQYKSTMNVYSLTKKAYISTTFNGTMTVDTDEGVMTIEATKKDTKETFTITTELGDDSDVYSIVTGKKNTVAGMFAGTFVDENNLISMTLSGKGTVKTKTTKGCGPCGDTSVETCTRITKLNGGFVGEYDCGCDEYKQHTTYDHECDLAEEKDTTICPIYGTWSATLKTVDGVKY